MKSFHFKIGDEVLKANKRKEGRKGGRLEANWSGPYVITSISEKGVATLSSKTGAQLKQNTNVSQLKPFIRPTLRGIRISNLKTRCTFTGISYLHNTLFFSSESKVPEVLISQGDDFQGTNLNTVCSFNFAMEVRNIT